jgi:hypothetical protein
MSIWVDKFKIRKPMVGVLKAISPLVYFYYSVSFVSTNPIYFWKTNPQQKATRRRRADQKKINSEFKHGVT